ncbi:unnamed protein product [Nesidiocoris tenuis]|uniref:Uncharacterized protein n=1 Tax=Nesidiocoris tenuis TaxID=355587 RepID=A0A6H5HEA6_9HEMI|nr:unnamed protein product [Nesidiocoris tenuis]
MKLVLITQTNCTHNTQTKSHTVELMMKDRPEYGYFEKPSAAGASSEEGASCCTHDSAFNLRCISDSLRQALEQPISNKNVGACAWADEMSRSTCSDSPPLGCDVYQNKRLDCVSNKGLEENHGAVSADVIRNDRGPKKKQSCHRLARLFSALLSSYVFLVLKNEFGVLGLDRFQFKNSSLVRTLINISGSPATGMESILQPISNKNYPTNLIRVRGTTCSMSKARFASGQDKKTSTILWQSDRKHLLGGSRTRICNKNFLSVRRTPYAVRRTPYAVSSKTHRRSGPISKKKKRAFSKFSFKRLPQKLNDRLHSGFRPYGENMSRVRIYFVLLVLLEKRGNPNRHFSPSTVLSACMSYIATRHDSFTRAAFLLAYLRWRFVFFWCKSSGGFSTFERPISKVVELVNRQFHLFLNFTIGSEDVKSVSIRLEN